MERPTILKTEVRLALTKMNRNRTMEPNWIVIQMLSSLDDFEINKITEIKFIKKKSDDIAENFSKSIFIVMQKMSDECEFDLTFSLISHIT